MSDCRGALSWRLLCLSLSYKGARNSAQCLNKGLARLGGKSLPREKDMSDWLHGLSNWLHGLPVLWMAILVFGFTYLVTIGIYAAITVFAVGERARSFKAISAGLLSPLGIIFALFVVFTAS